MRSDAGCVYDFLGFVHPVLTVPHDGMKFSTPAMDHDTSANNCALSRGGGWWYNKCGIFIPTATTLTPSWYCPATNSWLGIKDIHVMVKSQ